MADKWSGRFDLPMGASSRDPIVGQGDWGPVYRSPTGKQYWFEEPREEGHSVVKALARHIASQPVLDTAGDVVKALAQGAWDGISAPGRAAAGENVTLGDAWNTAGMVAVGGAPMLAPEGALRAGALRTGGKADEILDMLKTGRAAEVTDDMMAAADPQRLWAGYDLPMDEASRMARAEGMGFDTGTPLYRGDDAGLDNFRTGHLARADIGVTTSTSPNVSATYLTKDDSAMYPVMSSAQNKLELDAAGRNWTGVPADARTNKGVLNDVIEPKTYLDEDNLFDFLHGSKADWGDGTATSMAMSDTNSISRAAQSQGFDETRFNNIVDRGAAGKWHTGPANDPHTTVMTANPANIRSRFARFDPRLKHLANLSAGVGGVAAMTDMDAEKAAIQAYLDKWK